MLLSRKRLNNHKLSGLSKLTIVVVIISLSSSIIDTVWAVYMSQFLDSVALVGLFSGFLTIISFFSYFWFIPVMERLNKAQVYMVSLAIMGVSYVGFSIIHSFVPFALISIVSTIAITLRATSAGIILRDTSNRKKVANNFGFVYSLQAAAWIVGPLISGLISRFYDIKLIFSVSALLVFVAMLIFKNFRISDNNSKKHIDKNFIKNFKDFFKSWNRVKSYILNGGSSLPLVLFYLFMPLYIINNNLPLSWIGYLMFGYAIIPAFGEFFFGKLAGRIGYKKIFVVGFFSMSVLVLLAFFFSSHYVVLALLFLTCIGVSMTESTTDSYFLDITSDKEELRFFGPYNTAMDICAGIGKLLPSLVLLFLPFKFVFLVYGVLMLIIAFVSSTINDKIESRRK